MWLALAPLTASALTTHLSAVGFDLTAGAGWRAPPARGVGEGTLALGWFRGQFDDQFSFGRYWWVGPTARVDVGLDGAVTLAPQLEVRRGLDLLVAGFGYGLAGGVVVGGPELGWTARAVGVGRFRRSRSFSLTGRLEVGADGAAGAVGFAGGVGLGITVAKPLRALSSP